MLSNHVAIRTKPSFIGLNDTIFTKDMKELSLRVGFTVPERFGAGMECDSKANSAEEKSGAKVCLLNSLQVEWIHFFLFNSTITRTGDF